MAVAVSVSLAASIGEVLHIRSVRLSSVVAGADCRDVLIVYRAGVHVQKLSQRNEIETSVPDSQSRVTDIDNGMRSVRHFPTCRVDRNGTVDKVCPCPIADDLVVAWATGITAHG